MNDSHSPSLQFICLKINCKYLTVAKFIRIERNSTNKFTWSHVGLKL